MPRNRSLRPRACSCVRRPDSDGPMCICLHQSRGGEYHFEKLMLLLIGKMHNAHKGCLQFTPVGVSWVHIPWNIHHSICALSTTQRAPSTINLKWGRYKVGTSDFLISPFPDLLTVRYPNILKYPHFLICWHPAGVGVWEKARPDFNLVGRLHQRRCPGGRY